MGYLDLEKDSDDDDDDYAPESSSSESEEGSLDDMSDEDEEMLSSSDGESDSSCDIDFALPVVPEAATGADSTPSSTQECIKLCGDNIDKTVKARYMRSDKGFNWSLHYFHSYALLDQVDMSGLCDSVVAGCLPSPSAIAESLLPSASDDNTLKHHFAVLVS